MRHISLDTSAPLGYPLAMSATPLQFDPKTQGLVGPAGTLPIRASDLQAHRFLTLVEGECLEENIASLADKYGYCRQRYYQLLEEFKAGGLAALRPHKTGPKSNYRRTDEVTRQVLRHRFLDPDASAEVIAQKIRQTHYPISLRSVQRILADYGIQKKTLPPGPQKSAAPVAHPTGRKANPRRTRRHPKAGAGGSTTPGG
jgi:hypothetical protein